MSPWISEVSGSFRETSAEEQTDGYDFETYIHFYAYIKATNKAWMRLICPKFTFDLILMIKTHFGLDRRDEHLMVMK
jgi:hypothetical protein